MRGLTLFLILFIGVFLFSNASCITKEVPITETYLETEYITENKTETYTTTEDVVVKTIEGKTSIQPSMKWQTGIYFARVGSGIGLSYYYGYDISTIDHSRINVEISISSAALEQTGGIAVYDLTGLGQIPSAPTPFQIGTYKNGVYVPPPVVQEWLDRINSILVENERNLSYMDTKTREDRIVFDAKGIKEFCILANTWNARPISSVKLVWADDVIEQQTVTKERQVPYQVPVQVEKQRTVTETKKAPFWEAWNVNPPAETEQSSPSVTEPVVTETSSNTTTEIRPLNINDDFSNPNSGWGESSDNSGQYAYEDGEYSITINKMNWYGYHLNSVSGKLEDFTVEIDTRRLSQGIDDDVAGIIFKTQMGQENSFYVFWVDSTRGTYAIQKYLKGIWAPDLKDFTSSNYIKRGSDINRLRVTCKGSQIEVYANDSKLTTVTDASLVNGFIGLAVETITGSNAHYHFDNFKLYAND